MKNGNHLSYKNNHCLQTKRTWKTRKNSPKIYRWGRDRFTGSSNCWLMMIFHWFPLNSMSCENRLATIISICQLFFFHSVYTINILFRKQIRIQNEIRYIFTSFDLFLLLSVDLYFRIWSHSPSFCPTHILMYHIL